MQPPPDTARLFPHDRSIPDPEHERPYLLARLLEEGESADLRWLTEVVPEGEIAAWFATSGGRALTHRSRAFWRLVLAVEPAPPASVATELWPLV